MPITGDDWKTLEPYLDQALELAEAERKQWLADLAAARPDVARAIAGLLAEQERLAAESFLEGPAMAGLHAVAGAGLEVGHYTLEKPIGHGGMGTVWLARRNDGRFEGRAAVKLLNAALVGRPSGLRFVREGSVLANLTHPHIAHLIDAGVATTGQPYLVLEYVEGVRIDQYCEAFSLTPAQRVRLFLDVLAAVAHAHSHLVVHRDIKPSNILVTGDGVVKLLDFGIAALLTPDGEPGPLAALTREAGTALTPEFAAPEQLLNRPVTTATDVYALGLVLFVLLAGRHPTLVEGQSAVERVRTALDRESPRLSEVTAGMRIERTLRGDLDNIVAKALKLEPEERYATVAAFADDLRRYLADEPVQARADSLAYRAGKFVSRHRGSVLTGTATALGLVALTVFSLAQMREARRQRDEAVYQTKRAEAEANFFTLMISSVGEGGKPLTLPEILDKGLVLLDKQYGNDPDFVVHTLINMSGRYMDAGNTDKEYAALVKAEGLARKTADPMLLAIVQCNTVETEIAAGRMAQAAARLKEGQQALALADNPDVADAADCVHAAASLADAQGDTDGAIVLVRKALAMLAEAGRDRDNRYNGLLSHASFLYGKQGRNVEALALDQRSLQVYEQTGREGTEGAQATLHNVASALRGMGEIREALAREGQSIRGLRADDPDHPIHPAVSSAYGSMLARMGDPASGLPWLDRAVSDAHAGGNVSMEISSRINRSRVLVMAARAAAAGPDLDEVDRLARGSETNFRDLLQAAVMVRAEIQLSLGHPAEALATLAPVIAGIARPLRPGGGLQIGRSLIVASRAALAAQRPDEAGQFAADAVEVMRLRARRPEASADVGEAYLALAAARLAAGDKAGAREAAAQAVESLTNGLDASHPLTRQAAALARGPEA